MNKNSTKYVLFGVLAILVLLLNTSTALADINGNLRIQSTPTGANVYVLYGPLAGQLVGTTPFTLANNALPLPIYLKAIKPGYYQGTFALQSYMFSRNYINVYLVPLR